METFSTSECVWKVFCSVRYLSYKCHGPLQNQTISGLYSGIFALYLSCYGSKDTDKTKNILYYSLCVLYVLSVADLSLDIGSYAYREVSSQPIHQNDHLSFMLIRCAVRHRPLYQDIFYHCYISINSSWLLRLYLPVNLSMHKLPCLSPIVFIQIFKGLSLLDCVAPEYARRDHSINISIHIFRSVNLSAFFTPQQIPIHSYSYLDSERELTVL